MFDHVTRIRADQRAVASEVRAGWPAAALSQRVVDLAEIAERFDADLMCALGQWDAAGCWAEDGALSGVSWLAQHTPMSRAKAGRLLRAARLLREHEATAAALTSGAVSSVQVDTIATITRNREDLYPEGEEALLTAAEVLTADGFTVAARYWRACADDAAASEDAFAVHERRHLHLSKTLFGTVRIDGELDLDGGETVLEAFAAFGPPDGDDDRTGGQRNADTLVQMASMSLGGEAPDTPARPRANVVVGLEELAEPVPAELDHVGPIARETARRLTCDADVQRVVMSSTSEVLDLGRSTRVVSAAQRRALLVRDRGCTFPGCDRPPNWCDAHHLRHWAQGGSTDLDNLVLLCRRHHVLCHEGGWHLARGPDGLVRASRPDGSARSLAA